MIDPKNHEYAESYIAYFNSCAKDEPSFQIELETAVKVVTLMKDKPTTLEVIEAIKAAIASLEDETHYDGSGWYGFCVAVGRWVDAHSDALRGKANK